MKYFFIIFRNYLLLLRTCKLASNYFWNEKPLKWTFNIVLTVLFQMEIKKGKKVNSVHKEGPCRRTTKYTISYVPINYSTRLPSFLKTQTLATIFQSLAVLFKIFLLLLKHPTRAIHFHVCVYNWNRIYITKPFNWTPKKTTAMTCNAETKLANFGEPLVSSLSGWSTFGPGWGWKAW